MPEKEIIGIEEISKMLNKKISDVEKLTDEDIAQLIPQLTDKMVLVVGYSDRYMEFIEKRKQNLTRKEERLLDIFEGHTNPYSFDLCGIRKTEYVEILRSLEEKALIRKTGILGIYERTF